MEGIEAIAGKLGAVIINPLIALVFGAGVVVFVWGLIEYLYALNIKGDTGEVGKRHMIWGLVGLFIMVSVLGIVRLIAQLVGGESRLPTGF